MIELLKKRRSTRTFDQRPINDAQIEEINIAAFLSASSRDRKPWHIIWVKNSTIKEKLSICRSHGASFLKTSPLIAIIVADTEKSDVWIEDCSILSWTIQLQVESMGLGSCWVQVRERMYNEKQSSSSYIKELLSIPSDFEVENMIGIGYKANTTTSRKKEPACDQKIHVDIF